MKSPLDDTIWGASYGSVAAVRDAFDRIAPDYHEAIMASMVPDGAARALMPHLDANARGITDGIVTLLTPRRVDVAGDSGYAVVPATYAYKLHGKPVTESGNVLTVALHKTTAGWRITGWAWSRH